MSRVGMAVTTSVGAALVYAGAASAAVTLPNPVLFVTQVPVGGFTTLTSTFGSQLASVSSAPRGGDLWIRYTDGTLRNLTKEAGYGLDTVAQDGPDAIAVRQPSVHWSGDKALFAMAVGAPSQQYEVVDFRWQIYEVTGLAKGQTARIAKLPCQPAEYNNIAPMYSSDDSVLFVSDRPRNGAPHLYPQRDEYESAPIDTGIWRIDPATCTVRILQHAPSGVSYPSIDSAGQVLFTKWDHLQRDQQADADSFEGGSYGSFDYVSEKAETPPPAFRREEVFPELRRAEYSMGAAFDDVTIAPGYPFSGHTFNQFMPWTINQDGSDEELLHHLGRHELGGTYTEGSYRDDPALGPVTAGQFSGATQFLGGDGGLFHLREDPARPGRYWGVRAPEFATATAGDLLLLDARTELNTDRIKLRVAAATAKAGRMRNPLPLSDGQLVAVRTAQTGELVQRGTSAAPDYNYNFRLYLMNPDGARFVPGERLTPGIARQVAYWDPDQRVSWSGNLWELDPVEVRSRPAPPLTRMPPLQAPERQALAAAGVDAPALRRWLRNRQLALIVSRNVTTRDRADTQQPFNLRVGGAQGGLQTLGDPAATIYAITDFQIFQGDQVRGYADGTPPQFGGTVQPGRRVLARPLHDAKALAAMGDHLSSNFPGAVRIAADGSVAAIVPAGRALSWQLTNSGASGWKQAVVRERNWVSMAPGEIRVCGSCHLPNTSDQAGQPAPQNTPQALTDLLVEWKKVAGL